MHDLNIGDFCKDTARIILTLYRRFPQKSTLYVEDISGPDLADDFGLHSPRHMACFSAILWLAEEGWLRYTSTIQQDAVDEVVLSQKAFVFFASPATSNQYDNDTLNPLKQTRIQQLDTILQSETSDKLNAYVIAQMQLFLS